MMKYMSVKEASEAWRLSDRRIRSLCSSGRIAGAKKDGKSWIIPENASKPEDIRPYKSTELNAEQKNRLAEIDKKSELIKKTDNLTDSEKQRLNEEFIVNKNNGLVFIKFSTNSGALGI